MKFWKIIYYTGEGEYETRSVMVTDEEYEKVQNVMSVKEPFVILRGRPTIKTSLIASIVEDTDSIIEMQNVGIPVDGFLDVPSSSLITGRVFSNREIREKNLGGLRDWVKSQLWYKVEQNKN